MLFPIVQSLLILQDRDTKRLGLEAQLRAVPSDVALVERTIASEKAAIESARLEVREFEQKKKLLEIEIGSAEDKLGRYKVQQLSVRKNDEYQALGHEIATMQAFIGDLEGRELEIMYAIDEAKKRCAAAESAAKQNIAGHETRIRSLREREASLASELKTAQADVAGARTPVAPMALRIYDRLAARALPAVVPIRDSKCGGCHLKISSEAESAARGKNPTAELATCDQCGRIIYWEG